MQDKKSESLNLTVHSVSGAIKIKIKRDKGNNSGKSLLIPNVFEYFGNERPNHVSTKKKPLKDSQYSLMNEFLWRIFYKLSAK